MSYYIDSPIARCEAIGEIVLLDETQAECAREHHCPPARECPLAGCFTTVSGLDPASADAAAIADAARATDDD